MTEITLKSMRFHTRVGILANERSTAQPLEIDLTVSVREGDSVLDYRDLYEVVASIVLAGHVDYLEEMGDRIARTTLQRSDRIASVRVAVRKPHVALGGPLDYAEVVVTRQASA